MFLVFFIVLTCNTLSMQDVFHISYERSGGFTGMTTKVEVDSDELTLEEKEKVAKLIEEARFFEFQKADSTSSSVPDQYQYKITVEKDGNKRTIELGESVIPDGFRPLIDYLTQKARSARNR